MAICGCRATAAAEATTTTATAATASTATATATAATAAAGRWRTGAASQHASRRWPDRPTSPARPPTACPATGRRRQATDGLRDCASHGRAAPRRLAGPRAGRLAGRTDESGPARVRPAPPAHDTRPRAAAGGAAAIHRPAAQSQLGSVAAVPSAQSAHVMALAHGWHHKGGPPRATSAAVARCALCSL